jgi:hypothetical protein
MVGGRAEESPLAKPSTPPSAAFGPFSDLGSFGWVSSDFGAS